MKNAKKLLALLLALVMCVGMLASCSKPAADNSTPPADNNSTAPEDSTAPDTTFENKVILGNTTELAGDFRIPGWGGRSAGAAVQAAGQSVQAVARQEDTSASLPGASPDPCCMGSNAQNSVMVVEGFIQEELAASRQYLCLVCHIRNQTAAQLLRRIACEKQAAARELCGAYYLITGKRYLPSVSVENVHCVSLADALRSCYHQEACGGLNYARAADETTDKCLADLFGRLSEQSYQRAEDVMGVLGKIVCCS